ncbi:MAG: hypothetical protein IPM34_14920 [Saprospiraceae bacterium]|nr:hypothetical protein [Saprospiraceae bacterium]
MATRNHYNHGNLLKSKSSTDKEVKFIYESYLKFIKNISTFQITDDKSISKFVSEFNSYRESVLYTIENRKNSGQENLRSSMLEELFCHLFSDLIGELLPSLPSNLLLGKANSYIDLTFSPSSFREIL